MKNSELANRYARAIHEFASESKNQDRVFAELRVMQQALAKDDKIQEFMTSPIVKAVEKEKILQKALADIGICPELMTFVLLLARKNRLGIFKEIVEAYQRITDQAHGVTRGVVRSASALGADERVHIEKIVSQVTHKQVILNYTEDASLIGGLVADVGSYTFDDSLISHLRRLKDELNRSAH